MTTTFLAAFAVLALSAGAALAGEANGEPFPFRAPGLTLLNPQYRADLGSAQYPDVTGRAAQRQAFGGPALPRMTTLHAAVPMPPNAARG